MNPYTKEYYETSNYSDYKERGERYHKLAKEVIGLLESISLVNKSSFITDFGCATGHLLHGLKKLGYDEVDGVEISDWARNECEESNLTVFSSLDEWIRESPFSSDVVFALDVLEHMTDEDAIKFLKATANSKLILRIPIERFEGKGFHLEVSRKDPTHINCKTFVQWACLIDSCRKKNSRIFRLNLNTIYDSDGVMAVLVI